MRAMYRKHRKAVDAEGKTVEITERQDSDHYTVTSDGTIRYKVPAKFFGPDGKQLIPEGRGSFRSPFGIRYQLVD
jgi:hypothetical protein